MRKFQKFSLRFKFYEKHNFFSAVIIFVSKSSCHAQSNNLLGPNVILFSFLIADLMWILESKCSMGFKLVKQQNYPDWKNIHCERDIWFLHGQQFLIPTWTATSDSYRGHQHLTPTWTATSDSYMDNNFWSLHGHQPLIPTADIDMWLLHGQQHQIPTWTVIEQQHLTHTCAAMCFLKWTGTSDSWMDRNIWYVRLLVTTRTIITNMCNSGCLQTVHSGRTR